MPLNLKSDIFCLIYSNILINYSSPAGSAMSKLPPLTLDALEVLDAIDRKGSYAAAAIALNRVPSAISYTVQKLEQDLGITLFQRQGRKSVLTRAGQHLVSRGRELLTAASELAASTQQVATGWEPKLRIAMDHLLPEDYLLPLVNRLCELQPAIDIELTREVLAGTWEALLENRVDLAVGAVESPPGHQGLRVVPWQALEMIYVATPDHPVTQLTPPIETEELTRFRSVIVPDSSRNLPTLDRGIFNRKQAIHVTDMSMKIQAHIQGIGVGSVPRSRVEEELKAGRLVELNLRHPPPLTTTYLAWKANNRGQALKWMADELQRQAAGNQATTNQASDKSTRDK